MNKIGFCCQFIDKPTLKMRTTTYTSLSKMSLEDRLTKLREIAVHNFSVLGMQIHEILKYPEPIRCFRMSSDILPLYTHELITPLYEEIIAELPDISWIGPFALNNNIRLGFHPGQMTSLCSEKKLNIQNSLNDLEYHGMLAGLMNISDPNFSINIHGNNNIDPGLIRFKNNLQYLSEFVRKSITIENDEFSCGLQDIMNSGIYHLIPVVIDFHHHWIHSLGEYILPQSDYVAMAKKSWENRQPLSHVSISPKEEIILENDMPSYSKSILNSNRVKLRKHSYDIWSIKFSDYIKEHLSWTDIEIEAKGKDKAALNLIYNSF